jgi:PAS domain S-box-containing protein
MRQVVDFAKLPEFAPDAALWPRIVAAREAQLRRRWLGGGGLAALAAAVFAAVLLVPHAPLAPVGVDAVAAGERESRVLETHLEIAIHNAPVVLWTIDNSGVVTLSTGAALSRLGLGRNELVGKCLFDVYAEHPTIARDIRRALAGESFSYKTALTEVSFETWIAPIRDATTGAVSGAIAVSTDITERESLQAQSIRNDRVTALGSLAASVARFSCNPAALATASIRWHCRSARGFRC